MIDGVYVQKIVNKLKMGIEVELKKGNYEQALDLISNCANLIYQTNLYYYDESLEENLELVSNKLNIIIPYENEKNTVLFYDGFGLNNRGLIQIYLKALCQLKKVVYVTYEDCADRIPEILRILNEYEGTALYINRKHNGYIQQIFQLARIISEKKPHNFFFYSFPNDVVGVVVLNAMKGKICRYQINLTDHAFWIGARCIDKCIEFRDYGASISKKYRDISRDAIVKIPFYPIINKKQKFQGFPFNLKDDQKIIFSGGALYKTLGGQNKYYEIIDHVLKEHEKIIFWYAGSGDDSELKKLMQKYPKRVFHTSERSDLFQILERCRLFLNTYPICGGLMYQYAASAGIVPVTLKHDDDADGYLLNQSRINVNFCKEIDLYKEIDNLILDDSYFSKRKEQMEHAIISSKEFLENIQRLFKNETGLEINYTDIDIISFRDEYLKRLRYRDIDSFLVNKKTFKTSFKYIPFHLLRGLIIKITSKVF